MKVLFFKNDFAIINKAKETPGCCAFWYDKGLSSYKFIDKILPIEGIEVEESIYNDFCNDYPNLANTHQVTAFKPAASGVKVKETTKPICFFASNDTMIITFKAVLDKLSPSEYKVFCRKNEGAAKAGAKLGIEVQEVTNGIPNPQNYSLLVFCNDWGPLERKINIDFLAKGINTVCLQESAIDFNPLYHKMRNCSLPLFQGVATLENIDPENMSGAIIGNPRFENLRPSPLPENKLAFVNVNFTYGSFEEFRYVWVNEVVETCQALGIDYVLSQHPRDAGDLTGYNLLKSNPGIVHSTIKDSTVVITKFSALLLEAVALGRPAIYYNPIGEEVFYKFNPDNVMLFYATNKAELQSALEKILQYKANESGPESHYLEQHLGITIEGKASAYIAAALRQLKNLPPVKKVSVVSRIKIALEIFKLKVRNKPY